jgi:hypothetical protein
MTVTLPLMLSRDCKDALDCRHELQLQLAWCVVLQLCLSMCRLHANPLHEQHTKQCHATETDVCVWLQAGDAAGGGEASRLEALLASLAPPAQDGQQLLQHLEQHVRMLPTGMDRWGVCRGLRSALEGTMDCRLAVCSAGIQFAGALAWPSAWQDHLWPASHHGGTQQ